MKQLWNYLNPAGDVRKLVLLVLGVTVLLLLLVSLETPAHGQHAHKATGQTHSHGH